MAGFPNVPDVPGVPALLRAINAAVPDVVQLLTVDALGLFADLGAPLWGLFLNGEPVVIAESVTSFEYKKHATIASFPVEGGIFENYDKVSRPFDVRLQFTTGGTLADRQALRDSADAAVDSLDLMDAVTPLKTYVSVNPVYCDYRHTNVNGVGLLIVDMFCEQVRATATSSFSSGSQQGASSASASTDSSSSGGGGSGGGSTPTGISSSSGGGTVTITPTANWSPQSAAAASRVSDGTVQASPVPAGQFDLSGALP